MLRAAVSNVAEMGRSHELTWRYVFNLPPTLAYRFQFGRLSHRARRVLDDLNRDGVAISSVDELLGGEPSFSELSAAAARLLSDCSDELAAARAAAARQTSDSRSKEKSYLFKLLGDKPQLDMNDVFARFCLQEPILQIVNAYYGMFTCLRAFNVWYTFARQQAPIASQLWHRDLDDRYYTVKVFVYLSDVDEQSGPLIYAAGSHRKGTRKGDPPFLHKHGNTPRSDDAQMAQVVSEDHWVKCTGPKGTIVLADTRGYHKGGHARQRDRLVYLSMFTSRSGAVRREYVRCGDVGSESLSKEQAYAVDADRLETPTQRARR